MTNIEIDCSFPPIDNIKDSLINHASAVETMLSEVVSELGLVHSGTYDIDRARRTAALALKAQIEMAEYISDLEGQARGLKNMIESAEADAYFDAKDSSEKKISEAALQQMVNKNKKVAQAKSDAINAEREFKKGSNMFTILKDAHIFFRNIGNGKNEWSI